MKNINFAKNLRKLRRTEDITQKSLGELVGVKATAISSYENDESRPSLETIVRLADIFNISLDELIL